MKWTKGRCAKSAPVGEPLLVLYGGQYLVAKARNGHDRFAEPCLHWDLCFGGRYLDGQPERYWLLP